MASGGERLIVTRSPGSSAAEAYRFLRLALQTASPAPRSLLVASADEGPDRLPKAELAANLATAFALDGRDVLLVDADLRRPSIHEIFGLENASGLSSYLEDEGEGRVPLVSSGVERLRVMTSGPRVAYPNELLDSPRVPRAIKRLAGMADLVVFDAAPALSAADAAVLGRQLDACVLVVWEGRTRREAGRRAKVLLERAGARLLGVVLAR